MLQKQHVDCSKQQAVIQCISQQYVQPSCERPISKGKASTPPPIKKIEIFFPNSFFNIFFFLNIYFLMLHNAPINVKLFSKLSVEHVPRPP